MVAWKWKNAQRQGSLGKQNLWNHRSNTDWGLVTFRAASTFPVN